MKKTNNSFTKIISFILSFAIVFTVVGAYAPRTRAKTLNSLKSEYSEIQNKVSESEKKISQLEEQKAKQEEIVSALNEQISQLNDELANVTSQKEVINGDISVTEGKITNLNNEIQSLDEQIALKDEQIDQTIEIFCLRMKANYIAGETSVLEIFTSSSDLASFLNRLEMFKRVTKNDQGLVDELNEEIASIEKMQDELNKKKSELQTQKSELVIKRDDLQHTQDVLNSTQQAIIEKSNEVNEKIASLNTQTNKLNVSIDEYNAEMARIDNEIDEFIKAEQKRKNSSGSSGGSSSGSSSTTIIPSKTTGGWAWPVPYSAAYVISGYGYRSDPSTGALKFHGGIDITMGNAYGKNIIATRAGTVIRALYTSSGYGHYVMIDHGDGYVSLYGHCSDLLVSEGQQVSRGQVIARIGSTGYSTGPHCHFEIRYNGERVNPLNYVSR